MSNAAVRGVALCSLLSAIVVSSSIARQAVTVAAPLAITHITVIDTANGSTLEDMTVVVAGHRIARVAKSDAVRLPEGSFVVNGYGKFVTPGLWDMHVHVFGNGDQDGTDSNGTFFPLLVANGVVGVRDMGTDASDIAQANRWNQEIESGRLIAPRMIVTSQIVDGEPPTWSNSVVVRTAAEGRTAVRTLKASGAQTIKVYWNLSRDAYFAIADEAKKQGLPLAGHVPYVVSAAEASKVGQRSFEHLEGVAQACSSKESEWLSKRQARTWTPADALEMRKTFDESKCNALAARFKENNTWLVPTTVVFFDPKNLDSSSRVRFAPPTVAERMRQGTLKPGARADEVTRNAELAMRRTMRRAGGALFLAGTDLSAARPMNLPGFSLHDELALLVESGLTAAEALQSATYNAARFENALGDYGIVAEGRRADLLMLNANPLDDIRNISSIDAVVLNGTFLDRGKLNELLKRAEGAVKR
jgi:imidazolonepropionase-like amidohydrolase